MQKIGWIYVYINLINGKKYIGQTIQKINKRINAHKNSRDNLLLHNAINKYGINNFGVFAHQYPEEELDYNETFLIKELNAKKPNGYNLEDGGNKNKHLHQDTKDKMSKPKLGQSLGDLNIELSKQWHPTKNGNLTPFDVYPNSNKKVWWVCEKGHEWEAIIFSRNNGKNCPYCGGKKVCVDNCLAIKNPELSKQWHSSKNENLTPFDVTSSSRKKVWWICKICKYEWIATIASRNNGSDCLECYLENNKGENHPLSNPKLEKQLILNKHPNCIINNYFYEDYKLHFDITCENNHNFNIKMNNFKSQNNWCKECANENNKGEKNSSAKCYKITSPNNKIFIIKGTLNQFCRENNLKQTTIKHYLYKNCKKDIYKGWKIEYSTNEEYLKYKEEK